MSKNKNDQLIRTLKEHYVRDLQKKSFDKFERAQILKSMIKERGLSEREFGREFGIHHNTLQDWLMYDKPENKELFAEMREKGYKDTAIYRQMRLKNKSLIDMFARHVSTESVNFRRVDKCEYTKETVYLLESAVNNLNQLIVHINLLEKKNKTKVLAVAV